MFYASLSGMTQDTSFKQLADVLHDAEKNIQKLIASAAHDGDYGAVEVARSVAMSLKKMRDGLGHNVFVSAEIKGAASGLPKGYSVASKADDASSATTRSTPKKKRNRRSKKQDYPKFETNAKVLLRIGWSKKKREEYTHKVSREVFETVVTGLVDLANSTSGPVMAETLIERLTAQSHETIPSYQIYVVLGFLRQGNVIKQIGREGYSLPEDLAQRVRSVWLQ